ncbi:Cof-type HAD-IIB family hydrolase [Paenibacillus sp. FSL W8-0194]|uniref:Cof-type HAD-IIB family hydrolase n=1 Tax=Paenibacillus sp. FSL W8-0194 TaxID=2921711 RepID=UPI0030DBDDF1
MTYHMLCLDIDGTLLNSTHEISSGTKRAIRALSGDVRVVLVSARMPKGIAFIHRELGLDTPIICYSGALVVETEEEGSYRALWNKTMTMAQIENIYRQAKLGRIHSGFYKDDDWYVDSLDEWALQERDIAKTDPAVIDFEAMFRLPASSLHGAHKALCMGGADEIGALENSLKKQFAEELAIYRSKPTYLEIMDRTVSKTLAIRFLQERWNVAREQVIAVGDNFNDMDMLEYAGLGVAMGNAPESVKNAADEVTLSNDDDGVAKVIEKYFHV